MLFDSEIKSLIYLYNFKPLEIRSEISIQFVVATLGTLIVHGILWIAQNYVVVKYLSKPIIKHTHNYSLIFFKTNLKTLHHQNYLISKPYTNISLLLLFLK